MIKYVLLTVKYKEILTVKHLFFLQNFAFAKKGATFVEKIAEFLG